jgi:two-component system, OmpR family, alkaline phosphatase synthesis response regulator PhoP
MTRILVVEDDRDIAELVERYLQKAGFSIELLSSGRDALKAIADRTPDLLILDLMLPHVDGLEICRSVRSDPRTAAIPIIMLTARAEESERIVGLEIPSARTSSSRASARCFAARSGSPRRATSPMDRSTWTPSATSSRRPAPQWR